METKNGHLEEKDTQPFAHRVEDDGEWGEFGPEDEIISHEYETVLRDSNPVNQGQNGIIYRVSAERVPAPIKHKYHIEEDTALKTLKVYNGKGKQEYRAQKMAYDLVEANRAQNPDLAYVPQPLDYRKVKLSNDVREHLNRDVNASLVTNEAEVVMMDFVDGKDMATIFYQWVVDHPVPGKEYLAVGSSFDQLHDSVGQMLDFKRPNTKGGDFDRKVQARLVANENSKKLYDYLRRSGFRLNPVVARRIKATLKLFEQNGLYHNDNHERNFMLSGDYASPDSNDVKVYIIDFGGATINQRDDTVLDISLDQLLGQLEHGAEDRDKQQARTQILAHVRKISGDNNLPERFKPVYESLDKEGLDLRRILVARGIAATATEQSVDQYIGLLLKLVNDGRLPKNEAVAVVDHMRDSMKKPVFKKGELIRFNISNPAIYNRFPAYKELFE